MRRLLLCALCALSLTAGDSGGGLHQWLEAINPALAQYADALIEYGYSNAQMLQQMESADLEADFTAIKVKKPHRRMLIKACSAASAPPPKASSASGGSRSSSPAKSSSSAKSRKPRTTSSGPGASVSGPSGFTGLTAKKDLRRYKETQMRELNRERRAINLARSLQPSPPPPPTSTLWQEMREMAARDPESQWAALLRRHGDGGATESMGEFHSQREPRVAVHKKIQPVPYVAGKNKRI